MIHIKVNNKAHQFPDKITLDQIISRLDISVNGIAIAINQNIIARADWVTTTPFDGDAVLIIKATQGG